METFGGGAPLRGAPMDEDGGREGLHHRHLHQK
jgi:hypothetical protein